MECTAADQADQPGCRRTAAHLGLWQRCDQAHRKPRCKIRYASRQFNAAPLQNCWLLLQTSYQGPETASLQNYNRPQGASSCHDVGKKVPSVPAGLNSKPSRHGWSNLPQPRYPELPA